MHLLLPRREAIDMDVVSWLFSSPNIITWLTVELRKSAKYHGRPWWRWKWKWPSKWLWFAMALLASQVRSNVTAKAFSSTSGRLLNWICWMDGYVKRHFSFNWNKNTNPFGQRNHKKWYAVHANPPTAKFKNIYTDNIISFSLYGQICEPSKCQEALVKMLQLRCVFVSVVVHVLNMNLKSCSWQTSLNKINTEN